MCRSQCDDEGKSNLAILEIMPRLFQALHRGINPDYTMRAAAPIPHCNTGWIVIYHGLLSPDVRIRILSFPVGIAGKNGYFSDKGKESMGTDSVTPREQNECGLCSGVCKAEERSSHLTVSLLL